jgi:hypothetical protein
MTLVGTDVSKVHSASTIKVTRIGKLGTTLVATSNLRTLRRNTAHTIFRMIETIRSSETLILTRATRSNILEDRIFHSRHRENLKS